MMVIAIGPGDTSIDTVPSVPVRYVRPATTTSAAATGTRSVRTSTRMVARGFCGTSTPNMANITSPQVMRILSSLRRIHSRREPSRSRAARDHWTLRVVTVYDRSDLILRSIDNLRQTLIEELIIVAIVILIFLWHVPSALIPIITIPVTVAIAFIPMHLVGVSSNSI